MLCINKNCILVHAIVSAHLATKSSRSTSSERFILAVMVENTSLFWRRSGSGNSIFLGNAQKINRKIEEIIFRVEKMSCNYIIIWFSWGRKWKIMMKIKGKEENQTLLAAVRQGELYFPGGEKLIYLLLNIKTKHNKYTHSS